jgi:hypothetical protein
MFGQPEEKINFSGSYFGVMLRPRMLAIRKMPYHEAA